MLGVFFYTYTDGEASGWTRVSRYLERGFDPHLSPTFILTNMRATLKKPWRSPAGKLYPSGTMFVKTRGFRTPPWIESEWYDFEIPGVEYGMVLIPNTVFRTLTPEEREVKRIRQALADAHYETTKDHLLY